MAFTGSATVKQVSDRKVRITGLSLAGAASGTIGLHTHTGSAPGVTLPEGFQPEPYTNTEGEIVSLQDAIQVSMVPDTGVVTLVPIAVVKSGADDKTFLITLTNSTVGTASAEVEIFVEWH
jgi:hypothetical protein